MDIERVKAAFIKADDLAQQGDKQAAEDAAEFARVIKAHQSATQKPEESFMDKAQGVTGALSDFVTSGLGMVAGIPYGLYKGATGNMDFVTDYSQGFDEALEASKITRNLGSAPESSPSRKTTEELLNIPFEYGGKAIQGILSGGFASGDPALLDRQLQHPEENPALSAASDTIGMFAAGAGVHKGAVKSFEKLKSMSQGAKAVPELAPETVVAKPQPMPGEMGPLFESPVDTSEMRNQFGGPTGGRFMEGAELPPDATRDPVQPVNDLFKGETKDMFAEIADPLKEQQKEEAQRAVDFEARRNEFGDYSPERDVKDMAVPYEPLSLKDELTKIPEDWQIRDGIERGRESFPTIDIDLLPESVSKDSVIKGQLTKHNKIVEQINALSDKARDIAVAGERIKNQNVGRTKKSQEEVAQIKQEINALQKKADVINKQLYNRLSNKHGVKEPGMKLFRGREAEKTGTPDMQRSPEAKVTRSGPIQKTNPHPLGGVGKKQGGAIDTSIFHDGMDAVFKLSRYVSKATLEKISSWSKHEGRINAHDIREMVRGIKLTDEQRRAIHQGSEDGMKMYDRYSHLDPERRDRKYAILDENAIAFTIAHEIKTKHALEGSPYPNSTSSLDGLANAMSSLRETSKKIREQTEKDREKERLSKFKVIQGGVGKKQGGALDLSGIGKGLSDIVKAGVSVAKHTVAPRPNAPKQKGFKGVDRIRKITGADSRDVDTFVTETLANKEMLTDIDPALSIRGAIRQDLTPSHVGKLNYAHNPVISFVMHNLDKIDGKIKMAKESALWGDKFGTNMWGHPKKMKSDDGARTIMETLPKDRQEVLRETTMKYADGDILNKAGLKSPTDSMLSSDGLNTREIQAYRAAEKQLDTLLNKLNTMLTKAGKQPIAKLAGYFPAVWKGDYRLFVKDGQGNTIKTLAFDHMFQMTEAEKKIKAADPTLTTEQFESQRDRYNLKDVSAFQLAAQSFPSNHPTARLLDKIRSDVMKHRGFKKHGIQRKGVEGFMGSEKGDVAGMKQAMDIYLEQGYNFLADMEKQQFLEDVRTGFREKRYSLAEKLPNTDKYVSDAVGNSIGALKNGLEMIDNVIEGVAQIMAHETGVGGKSTPKKAIRAMNGLAAFHYLATFKQYGLNLFQPVFSIPKAIHATEGLKDRAMLMPHFMQAYMEAFVPKAMTPSSKAALAYGKHTGMIDARTLDLINSNAGSFMKKFGHIAAVFEQEAVRVPTYLFYDKILKDTIPDNKTRWDAAAQMTADSMVNYSKTQTPQVYQRAGLVGEATKSMQQFMHNYHGQLAEYMQLAMREKQFGPLVAFLAVQWVIGGLTGITPLLPINTLLGAFTGSKNTVQDWIEGSGMSDLWTMGPASKITGLHLAESGSAPSIVPQPGAVGIELFMKLLTDIIYQPDETKPGGLAVRAAQGVATSADKMQAAMTASPNLAKGFVEDIWKDPQGRIPNPKNSMVPDLPYKKEGWDEFSKNYLGAPSASEGAAKMRMRAMDDDMRGMEKQQAMYFRKLVSDFVDGQFNEEVFNKFVAKEGDPRKIKAAFKQAVIKRTMSKLQNEMVSSGKWKRAQLMEKMQEYQIKMEKMPLQDLAEINR